MNLLRNLPRPSQSAPLHWGLGSLVDVVRWRAEHQPQDAALSFLVDGRLQANDLSYAELDLRARALAVELEQMGAAGEPVLVVLEPGLDYAVALLGCFYAGAAATPVYPPDPFRIARTLPRLQAIVANSQCRVLIGATRDVEETSSAVRRLTSQAVAIDRVPTDLAARWRPQSADPERMVLLQYTSGTTAVPRGVAVTSAALMHNLRSLETLIDVPDAVALQWLPPYHDLGLVGGVLLPLFAGRRMVLMSPLDFMRSPAAWLQALSHFRATTTAAPNFGYELCLNKARDEELQGLDLSALRVAISGAEPVRSETLRRFAERFAPYGFRYEAFVPAYGMAEATLMVSVAGRDVGPVVRDFDSAALAGGLVTPANNDPARRLVGCGPAGPGVEVRVVDPATRRHTQGVGELWIRGPGMACGYWRNPAATAETFDASIEGGLNGDRRAAGGFVRTGDLGFVDRGELFITGRLKELLILGGRNFYPHDLEAAIQQADPAFKPDGGAVVAVERGSVEGAVVYQEVLRPKQRDLAALCDTIRRVLFEETGVEPLAVHLLSTGELPKTSSGKTQRSACGAGLESGQISPLYSWSGVGPLAGGAPTSTYQPPATPTEQWLAPCWAELLGAPRVGRDDSLIALGGQSIQAIEMLHRVAQRTGFNLPYGSVVDHPTLAEFAAYIDSYAGQPACAPQTAGPRLVTEATPAESRFLLLDQLGIAAGGANLPVAVRLQQPLEAEVLARAMRVLIERHAALRTAFDPTATGWNRRVVAASALSASPVEVQRLPAGPPAADPLRSALDLPWVWRPFDVANPPLLRAALLDDNAGGQVLLLVLHHAVADGAALRVLLEEIATLCRGERLAEATEGATPAQVPADRIEAYWRERLTGAPTALNLPLGRGRSDDLSSIREVCVDLPAQLAGPVRSLARGCGVTDYAVYLAALHALLARFTGDKRVVVGAAAAGRGPDTARQVACLLRAFPVLAQTPPELSFMDLAQSVGRNFPHDADHADTSWEAIAAAAGVSRELDRPPLAQAFFLFDDLPLDRSGQLGPSAAEAATDYRGLAVYDLTLVIEQTPRGRRARLVFDPARLDPQLAQRMVQGYAALLRRAVDRPELILGQLPPPDEAESQRQQAWGAEPTPAPKPIEPVSALERWRAEKPESIAVVCGGQRLTYAALGQRCDCMAAMLRAQGVGPGDRVALLGERSVNTLASMLAVWRVGAAYVPLEPSHPAPRIAAALRHSGARGVLSDATTRRQLAGLDVPVWDISGSDNQASTAFASGSSGAPQVIDAASPAYVIYTSGSTGEPKGVAVPHGAVANLLGGFADLLALEPSCTSLAATTIAFDISLLELMLPLTVGGAVLMADSATAHDPQRLAALASTATPRLLQGTPSTYRALLGCGWAPAAGQTLLCGGEALDASLAVRLLDSGATLWNVYGPTETTVWSTAHRVQPADLTRGGAVTIGRPIAGTRCYVLDPSGGMAPQGVWGELAVAGRGVAIGYWNQPELTAARFPRDLLANNAPQNGRSQTMYLTGDVVRWSEAGTLEFRGRRDQQVKVRGHRVELGEIEAALAAEPDIAEGAVLYVAAACGDPSAGSLAGFYAPAPGSDVTPGSLRERLSRRLPEPMIPSTLLPLERLPRGAGGKIDRGALAALARQGGAAPSTPYVAPRTPVEGLLAGWCQELLQVARVGIHDSLFELGGHSLTAVQLGARVRQTLGVELELRRVYARPTVADWAEMIVVGQLALLGDQAEGLMAGETAEGPAA